MTTWNQAMKQALMADAMTIMFPNAENMSEKELAPIYDQLKAAESETICPYSREVFDNNGHKRHIMIESDGTVKVGVVAYMKVRATICRAPFTALHRVLEPILKLYIPKRDARLRREAEIAASIAKVNKVAGMLACILRVDGTKISDDEFDVALLELCEDQQITQEEFELYRDDRKRMQEEAELQRMLDEDAARLEAERVATIIDSGREMMTDLGIDSATQQTVIDTATDQAGVNNPVA